MHGNTDAHTYNFTSLLCVEYNSVHIILYTPLNFQDLIISLSLQLYIGVAGFVSQVDVTTSLPFYRHTIRYIASFSSNKAVPIRSFVSRVG